MEAAPNRADAPTSKEYFHGQTNFLSDALKLEFWISGVLHKVFPWKALIKAAIFFDCQNSEFSVRLFYNKYKASTVKTYASSFLKDC